MVIFFLILLATAAAAEYWSLNHVLDGVRYDLQPDRLTVDPGEVFHIVTTLENHKPMPVSYLQVQELLPEEIAPQGDVPVHLRQERDTARLYSKLYLGPRRSSRRSLAVTLPRRGRYFFRGATLYGGDFLGLHQQIGQVPLNREVVVYPAPCSSPELDRVLGGFLGDISVRRFILEDPVLITGFREYTGREPFRSISWPQSARAGRLMVKQYDHTAEPAVSVLLNVEHRGDLTKSMTAALEQCYSLARTVCQELDAKNIRFDFLTNATAAGALGMWDTIQEGSGPRHLSAVLEGLGRATYASTVSFDRLVARSMRRTDAGRARVIITPQLRPEDRVALDRLRALRGGPVQVLTPELLQPEEQEAAL